MGLELLNSLLDIKFGLKIAGKCCNNYKYDHSILKQVDGIEKYSNNNYILELAVVLLDETEE